VSCLNACDKAGILYQYWARIRASKYRIVGAERKRAEQFTTNFYIIGNINKAAE